MLYPNYLDGVGDGLTEIYAALEADILKDIARRMKKVFESGKASLYAQNLTEWQAQILAEMGGIQGNIAKILRFYGKDIQTEIERLVKEAIAKNAANDNRVFQKATGRTVSENNEQLAELTAQKCAGDLSRLTLTSAHESQTQFLSAMNQAYMQVATGAFDYDTALKNSLRELADNGVRCVINQKGKRMKYSLESAVRMNIVTGINQTAAQATKRNCEEVGCDLVETSAHAGARPSHAEWQGEVFSVSGKNKKYRPFSVCGLGKADGICGINCRHSYYPYFEGMERHYDAEAVAALSKKEIDYNGEKLTRYEAEQKLRGIERNIRKYKKRAAVKEGAGLDCLKEKQAIGQWQKIARDFVKQTGLRRDYAREYIGVERTLWNQGQAQPRGSSPIIAKEDDANISDKPFKTTDITVKYKNNIFPSNKLSFSEKEKESMKWVDSKINEAKRNVEKMILLSSKGEIISVGIGEQGRVGFTNSESENKTIKKTKEMTLTMFHNHYYNSTFSGDDIDMLLKQSSLRSIYAVCSNGTYFKLTKTHNFDSSILYKNIKAEYNKLLRELKNQDLVVKRLSEIYDLQYTSGVFK